MDMLNDALKIKETFNLPEEIINSSEHRSSSRRIY
jgi:hypothetical protein